MPSGIGGFSAALLIAELARARVELPWTGIAATATGFIGLLFPALPFFGRGLLFALRCLLLPFWRRCGTDDPAEEVRGGPGEASPAALGTRAE